MTDLLTYHDDPKVKASLLRRIRAHEKADRLTQGTYGSMSGYWRGCAVSCSLATPSGRFDGEIVTEGLHAEYPKQLGLPVWLAHLEDRIFEGLPQEEAMQWPRRFAEAIPVGVSLDGLADELAVARLREECLPLSGTWPESIRAEVVAAIEQVIAALEGKGDRSAAWSAESAARSAAWSARSAAWSARSAWWWSASASAAYTREANRLIAALEARSV